MITSKLTYIEYLSRMRFFKTLALLVAFMSATGATLGLLAAYDVFDESKGAPSLPPSSY